MKKEYLEPETEIIRYNDEDVIMTSSHHHCGTGVVTGHEYGDTTGDNECDTDEDYNCGGGAGDYSCTVVNENCSVVDDDECEEVEEDCEEVSDGT